MLDSLYIKNFRLFKELKIERLGRVNLIVGRNNSGKTCLLEALWVYGSNAYPSVLETIIANRDENWEGNHLTEYGKNHPLQYIYPTSASVFEPITIAPLNSSGQRLTICIAETEKYLPEMKLVFENYSGLTKQASWLFKEYPSSVNFPDFPNQEHTQFVGTTAMENHEVENLWNRIFVTPLEEHVLNALHLFDDKIQKVGLIVQPPKNIPMIFLENKRLPLRHLGEGMYRVFHIILALVNAKEGLLLIDEFENGLHYTIQPQVWALIFKLAKALNVQVFVTTHSKDCVESFHAVWENDADEGTLHRLNNDSDEGVSVMPYDCELVGYAVETHGEVR